MVDGVAVVVALLLLPQLVIVFCCCLSHSLYDILMKQLGCVVYK